MIARSIQRLVAPIFDALERRQAFQEQTVPATKIALRQLLFTYQGLAARDEVLPSIWDTGFRVFSQADEDGVLLFLLGVVGISTARFVDIGGGDGLWASNCANLALNLGFHGVIIDADAERVERGRRVYRQHPDTRVFPPIFHHTVVTRETVNPILRSLPLVGEIDVLSIDIDGNDYWIWEAIEAVSPRIVVIEVHPAYGLRDVIMPYDEAFVWRSGTVPRDIGASPTAMTTLAQRLGYRLVGGNRFGFNAIYLRNDLGRGIIPTQDVAELYRHDWAKPDLPATDPS